MDSLSDIEYVFASTFKDIAVADAVIKRHIKRSPADEQRLNRNFIAFMRSKYITTGVLYEKHCDEIAWRIIRGEDTRPATDAELLNMMTDISLQTKLNADGVLVFDRLFSNVMGGKSPVNGIYPQPYQGFTSNVIESIRKKYVISQRTIAL